VGKNQGYKENKKQKGVTNKRLTTKSIPNYSITIQRQNLLGGSNDKHDNKGEIQCSYFWEN
jgi:hypothetical protein